MLKKEGKEVWEFTKEYIKECTKQGFIDFMVIIRHDILRKTVGNDEKRYQELLKNIQNMQVKIIREIKAYKKKIVDAIMEIKKKW